QGRRRFTLARAASADLTLTGGFTLSLLMLLLSCATQFNPRTEPTVASPDQAADRAFREARARFEARQFVEAQAKFERFVRDFPRDPLRSFAFIFSGRAAYERGDHAAAAKLLEGPAQGNPEQPATEQARFYLGLARARLGECKAAHGLL